MITENILRGVELPNEKVVIWEIGAGYGGLARILKCYIPNSCHIILDLPETPNLRLILYRIYFPDRGDWGLFLKVGFLLGIGLGTILGLTSLKERKVPEFSYFSPTIGVKLGT